MGLLGFKGGHQRRYRQDYNHYCINMTDICCPNSSDRDFLTGQCFLKSNKSYSRSKQPAHFGTRCHCAREGHVSHGHAEHSIHDTEL